MSDDELAAVIDPIFETVDLDKDGYILYSEYVVSTYKNS